MLRIMLSKLKQVCATALIPNILRETKTLKKDIDKCSIGYLNKTTHKKYKSTDTGSKDENNKKRKAIIEKCFSEPTLLHMKDNEKSESAAPLKPSTEYNNKSLISTTFGIDKVEQNRNEEALRIAKVQAVAAKIEEVKQAHDTIHRDGTLNVEFAGSKEENTTEKAQNTVQIDRTPSIEVDGVKDVDAPKASALLRHTNVPTTTGNVRDDKKSHTQDLNVQEVSEALKNAEQQANAAKREKEELAQSVVHIDKTPHFDISGTEVKDPKDTLSVSAALQKDEEDEARREKEKLAQHTVNLEKTPMVKPDVTGGNPTPEPSELKQKVKVEVTTAKIEEEKLAQKIDQIEETPHVEAGVEKVEGFNVSPKILGHDTTHNLSISESVPESDQPEQVNLEELAKKCLGKPDGDVDQILLKEMKNLSNVNSLKFDLPKDDSSQKYFSQIFQDKTKKNDKIVFDISDTHLKQLFSNEMKNLTDNEMRFDNFQPFHLDTVPLITTDTREYKDEFNKKYSPDVKNVLLDIPAVLDPYEMQAKPFHQYVNKDNIVLQELQLEESPTQKIAEVVQRSDINAPMNEEVILQREEETESIQEPALNNELKDLEEGETEDRKVTTANTVANTVTEVDSCSKSTETPTMSESDVAKLLEYKTVLTASEFTTAKTQPAQPLTSTMEEYPLENPTQTVLTTPTHTDEFGNPIMQGDAGHTKSEMDKRPDEMRTDTAISANQDPEEYFPTNHFNSFMGVSIQQVEYAVSDSVVTYTGIFDSKNMYDENSDETTTDNPISQSISYYSTFPQLSEFLENPKDVLNTSKHDMDKKERFTHVILQPDSKQEDIRVEFVQPDRKGFRKEIIVQEPRQEERIEAANIENTDTSSLLDETLPLSVLLRRVRQRNRMELLKSVKAEAEAKKPNCLPPLDKSKPRTELRPPPCKPKPKVTDNKCKDTNPCKPPKKKDPCAKFIPFLLHTVYRSNLDVSLPHHTKYEQMCTYISLAKEIALNKLKQLGHFLGILNIKYRGEEAAEVVWARDFEPWVPIPFWPLPQVQKRRPFVCPKEGCKLPVHPIRSNTDKPCVGMPKKISPSKTVKISA